MDKKTIFDKIMELPLLNIFQPFYIKHKQSLLYLFFGGLSFVLSTLMYIFFSEILHVNILIANIISWILIVAFCFVTNKIWVFEYKSSDKSIIRQIIGFYTGRFATLIIEELILYIFAVTLCFNHTLIKIIAQVIVIITNYFVSKFIIFKKK